MATLKEFEDALKAAGNTAALEILESLRARDRSQRSVRPARRLTGRKMTPELAAEILHLHETTNMTQQEIAFQLGVNQGRVNEVIKRRKWLTDNPEAPEAQARDKAKQRAKEGVGVAPRRPARKKKEKVEAAPETAQPVAEVVAESVTAPEPVVAEPVAQEPAAQAAPEPPMAAPELPVEQPEAAAQAPAEPAAELPPDVAKEKAKGKARKRGKDKEPPAQLLFKDLL
ncbi:hypothetical protein E6C67_02620 [Azospirillum sp. TSA2s]|uniref:hypothetical protein n=1 Tax=Azospirillum sp. TSA2s TaxID=709810 RepID=UPI0010AA20A2|nr:hypothetical protein [Azospirillum sp. TSA2s]QCG92822.1 hypothetical protein E6C67_02620 [Azospirillum sp. TSA2s]